MATQAREASYRDAVVEALDEELARDESVFLMGQDVGRMGGNFATTRGLFAKYGAERVRDTPISEDAIVGVALGAAIGGQRPVAEVMFSSFLGCCMDEICNHVSQLFYVSQGLCVPRLTLRTVNVLGRSSGCHHSGRPESGLMHLPGLVVLAPATPYDVKAMLKQAIRAEDPVVFIEHAMLYGSETGPVGGPDDLVPFGKARTARSGSDVTLACYSATVRLCLAAAAALERAGVSAEVLDLRSLAPLDDEALFASVARTRRLVVVEEDVRTAGAGAEIVARVTENLWDSLAAAPARVAAADTPVPFSPALEEAIVPTASAVVAAALRQMDGRAPTGR
jgi:acetoin:2,6-dichlorophenolindophenol oxidoreductase subunit beta